MHSIILLNCNHVSLRKLEFIKFICIFFCFKRNQLFFIYFLVFNYFAGKNLYKRDKQSMKELKKLDDAKDHAFGLKVLYNLFIIA